jgi:hypothetical protein
MAPVKADPFKTDSDAAADEQHGASDDAAKTDAPAASTSRKAPAKGEGVKQDKPEVKEDPNANPQFFVWLANGEILRVDEEDVPTASGSNAPFGHWQRGNDVHHVVGVYPAEVTVEG